MRNKKGVRHYFTKIELIHQITSMFRNHFYNFIYLSVFLCCSVVLADEAEVNTTNASGGNQIVVSPINILLDLGEMGYAGALVIDKDGNPVEGEEIQIIPQDNTKIVIDGNNFITNESGTIHFTIIGKQQGDTVVTVSDPPEQLCRAGGG